MYIYNLLYIYIYVCMCVCVYVCMCVCVYVCMCVRTQIMCIYELNDGHCVSPTRQLRYYHI